MSESNIYLALLAVLLLAGYVSAVSETIDGGEFTVAIGDDSDDAGQTNATDTDEGSQEEAAENDTGPREISLKGTIEELEDIRNQWDAKIDDLRQVMKHSEEVESQLALRNSLQYFKNLSKEELVNEAYALLVRNYELEREIEQEDNSDELRYQGKLATKEEEIAKLTQENETLKNERFVLFAAVLVYSAIFLIGPTRIFGRKQEDYRRKRNHG